MPAALAENLEMSTRESTGSAALLLVVVLVTARLLGVGTLLWGCGAVEPDATSDSSWLRVERLPGLMLISNAASKDASWVPRQESPDEYWVPGELPVEARVDGDSLVCRRRSDGPTIRYLTYEREADRGAYGVYGLRGLKNGLAIPRPLRGEPVVWSECNEAQALVRLLGRGGLPEVSAQELVDLRGAEWFGEGLRVFFVLDAENARQVELEGGLSAQGPVLIHVELQD